MSVHVQSCVPATQCRFSVAQSPTLGYPRLPLAVAASLYLDQQPNCSQGNGGMEPTFYHHSSPLSEVPSVRATQNWFRIQSQAPGALKCLWVGLVVVVVTHSGHFLPHPVSSQKPYIESGQGCGKGDNWLKFPRVPPPSTPPSRDCASV